jgi:hypothetical protein
MIISMGKSSRRKQRIHLLPEGAKEVREFMDADATVRPATKLRMERVLRSIGITEPAAVPEGSVLVCCTSDMPSPFPDNVPARCAECGISIYHRPYVPPQLRKVCIPCGHALLLRETMDG